MIIHLLKTLLFVFMSDQIFLLSDQNVALGGNMSFQGKKIICSPADITDKIKKLHFQELYKTCHCIADIEMSHGNYYMLCEIKKHTYGW